ncbi:hypothetical protein VTJ83DRAFT_5548 [Remersonia thermophila]|uniref:Dihydrodipicolinate synthetase n=1 Tax=Remersonia thermophila TaxID=72144 RepID=A0ABR4D8L3_9PEZI
MAPHNDAPSPSGSYTSGFNRLPSTYHHHSVLTEGLMVDHLSPLEPHSPLSSSFSTTSESSDFHPTTRRRPDGIQRPLIAGVYVPTLCFFEEGTEDLDVETIARHAVRLARAGVAGIATQGSNGEAVHLSHSERRLVTSTTRRALDAAGFAHMPVIVGCGAQSTRETVQLCRDAWESGGDYALVLPPSYYASLFAPQMETVVKYFTEVADASPIPIIIYNFPGAAGGLDLSSDVIIKLSQHPNIVGVKLTCGNTGKLNRIASATRGSKPTAAAPPSSNAAAPAAQAAPSFLVLAGSADFTVQSMVAGGHGILAGLANIAPRACVKTVELCQAGRLAEAQALQEVVARGDWTAIQGGVVGSKSGMQGWMGYGGYARSPLPRPTPEQAKQWKEGFRELVLLEKTL